MCAMATRWGICATGRICNDFAVAIKTLPAEDHQIVAVAASELSQAEEFAKKHDIPKAYDSFTDMAKDPNIDVVYIGIVTAKHHEFGLLFLRAGKNVLCEKPLAMNVKEVKELISASRENDVFLMEAFWTRFFPAMYQLRQLLAEKAIGDIKGLNLEIGMKMDHVHSPSIKEIGGGALLDLGCYCVQLACMVFTGERPEVKATSILTEQGVDEVTAIILKFPSNRLATITCSTATQLPNRAVIFGTKGTIVIPTFVWCPTSLIVNGHEIEYPLPPPSRPLNYNKSTGLRYEAEEVRQCLLKGMKESPIMPLADSELVMSILCEIRRQCGVAFPQDAT
ncbi:trans-1,2-dihydrobenzene-1,2-diol dehydrogenase-like [Protopterus annectens]|uniref:trans-1,2-dihydrobenzene-1,2-diol dehydrogenase-like n=1 Tax=Protopterus annectens TaxID=7888 RepID=UPI001CFB2543|nr:trans-1,2-dihydrobenzene-1,2-diol dehydrogenase-like [Protopterus annectens]